MGVEFTEPLEPYKLPICKNFILNAIKNVYPELDLASYLLAKNIITKQQYTKSLEATNYLEILNSVINWEEGYNFFLDFQKRFVYLKKIYELADPDKNLGRVGEMLNYFIFSENCHKSMSLFHKMTSNIFSPGIDFIKIIYNLKTGKLRYFFFEVKATIDQLSSQKAKVRKWYEFENFTGEFVNELDYIKSKIVDNQKLEFNLKETINNDLEELATILVNGFQPPDNFYFCSTFFFERGFTRSGGYTITKDERLSNGNDYFIQMENFYKAIRRAFFCLGIVLKK